VTISTADDIGRVVMANKVRFVDQAVTVLLYCCGRDVMTNKVRFVDQVVTILLY